MSVDTIRPFEPEILPSATTKPQRLVIVPQMDVFWHASAFAGLRNVCWTHEGIAQVMQWCDFRQASDDSSLLIVAEPGLSAVRYRTNGYRQAWESWCRSYSKRNPKCELLMSHHFGDDPERPYISDEFGYQDGLTIKVECFPQEFTGWTGLSPWTNLLRVAAPSFAEEVIVLTGTADSIMAQPLPAQQVVAYLESGWTERNSLAS